MTATLLEKNTTPLQRVEVDIVTVDIIENALRNVRVEMRCLRVFANRETVFRWSQIATEKWWLASLDLLFMGLWSLTMQK